MPSQEDYLDNLLKDMAGIEEKLEEDAVANNGMEAVADIDSAALADSLGAVDNGALADSLGAVDSGALADSLESVDSGALADSLESIDSGALADNLESVDGLELADSLESIDSGAFTDSLESVDSAALADSLGAVDSGAFADSLESVDSAALADSLGAVDGGAFADSLESIDSGALADSLESIESGAFADNLESVDGLELADSLESVDNAAFTDSLESVDGLELADSLESSDSQGLIDGLSQAADLDAVSDMTEEEIERLLSAGTQLEEDALLGASDMDLSDEDVLKMLAESDDSDLREIQDLLEKSDKNEVLDDSIEGDIFEEAKSGKLGDFESDSESVTGDRGQAPQGRKELARAKREEAAARKAEKKAAKEAAKAAAKKAKADRKGAKAGKTEYGDSLAEESSREEQNRGLEESSDENLYDMSVLDSIVNEADRAGRNAMQPESSEALEEPIDVFAEEMKSQTADSPAASEEESGSLGLDLDGLFGDGEADDSLLEGGKEAGSDFPDFLAMDEESGMSLPGHDEMELGQKDSGKEKRGFFSKILDFLTEDDEENEDIRLSQENKSILKELDSEENSKGKKGKKGKEVKKAKDKKDKPKKEAKPKKPPKPKKEKPIQEAPLVPEKKLSFKKVLPVLIIGVSVGVLLFVFVNSAVDYSDKQEARAAYYEGDYQTCYQNLFGKKLDETESVMFGKSESILYIRLWLREYEMFVKEGSEVEALDSLIQTVDSYPELYEYANQWNAGEEVAAGYATILNILADKYGLTEREAMEIASEPSDVEYTKMVTAIAGGRAFGSWNDSEPSAEPERPVEDILPDKLPEEDELGKDTFIDNNP